MVGRDLFACSRFWGRDRLSTSVVRGASPFWKSSFVRATNRHVRDNPANLPLSLGVVGRSRRAAETPKCHWFFTFRRSWSFLTAEPMHPPAHSPTAFVGRCRAAVPTLSGANIGSSARSGAGFLRQALVTPTRARGLEFFGRKARQTALARSQNATDREQGVVRFCAICCDRASVAAAKRQSRDSCRSFESNRDHRTLLGTLLSH